METSLLMLSFVIFLALAFDFINGFHDTANAIATSVSTRALKPRTAIIMAALMNFIGALMFTGVAKKIGGSITDPTLLTNGIDIVAATLIAAIIWNLITCPDRCFGRCGLYRSRFGPHQVERVHRDR